MKTYTYWDDLLLCYVSINSDNYCGCNDCNDPIGYGVTQKEAIDDLNCYYFDYKGE